MTPYVHVGLALSLELQTRSCDCSLPHHPTQVSDTGLKFYVSDEARILAHKPAALPLQTQFMEIPPFQWLRAKTLESVSPSPYLTHYSQPFSKHFLPSQRM